MRKTDPRGGFPKGETETSVFKGYVYSGTAILLVLAAVTPFVITERLMVLHRSDVLFGLSNRNLLVLAGLLHLAVSGYVFAARSLTTQATVLLWLGLKHLIYRAGLVWMHVPEPPPVLEAVGLKCGIRPALLDTFWKGFIAYLIIGSALVLFSEWRRAKRERAEEFMKNYQKKRRQLNPESGPK